MKSDVWKKLCAVILTAGFAIFTSLSLANAQDGFREFDRRMVATPAELFESLSSLKSSKQRKQIAKAQQKALEKAGREFLSRLSPEEKKKAWEFAEKYWRKNGVDSAPSLKLMEQFGLPKEMQNELSKQFRRHSDRLADSETQPDRNANDAINEIMRKAEDKFKKADATNRGKEPARVAPNVPKLRKPEAGDGRDKGDGAKSIANPTSDQTRPREAGEKLKDPNSGDSNPSGETRNANRNTDLDQQKRKSKKDRTRSQANNAGVPNNPFAPRSNDRVPDSNRSNKNQPPRTSEKKDVDLEQILRQLEERKKALSRANSRTERISTPGNNQAWQKLIEDMAEKGTYDPSRILEKDLLTGTGVAELLNPAELERARRVLRELTASGRLNSDDLSKAQEVFKKTLEARKKAESKGWDRTPNKSTAPSEKVGTRFDRLLVQAAERTLGSEDNEDGVTEGVSSILGNLIERVQDQAKKKDEDKRRARNSNRRKPTGRLDSRGVEMASSPSGPKKSNSSSGGNSDSASNAQNDPAVPGANSSSLDPRSLLDSIPDLSSINPTQIFTFFAIVGLILFVGYLLAQSLVGDEQAAKNRKFIKEIRAAKIDSPKDLVETVDAFLLSKFGIKSSWWNAGLAQRVLNSGSPDFQVRVDELIHDYVRARYMRNDIQIPEADQQRYKKTLEELSLIDIKPVSVSRFDSAKPVLSPPASVEG